ncbi:MAG: ferrous iron transport protein B [Bacteroidales bacterium]|nr:ferrous iron transport protein B [Bacteroidales bacterium]
MRLSDLKSGQSGVIVKVLGHGAFRKRVIEMGFVKGRKITAILSAPLKDPVKYRLMGYEVSLRCSEASMVEVIPIEDEIPREQSPASGYVADSDEMNAIHRERYEGERHIINVALIGNPNCGKTSLFNVASGSQEHVGNYSGVTVDAKKGVFSYGGYTINIIDLPGTYSLSAYSPEEKYVRRYLRDSSPDIIVNVVDGSNLERNLYLTTELIDMDYPMVIALNMFDEMRSRGMEFDYEKFGSLVGIPVVPTVSRNGEGVDSLFNTIIEVYERRNSVVRHVHVKLGQDFESCLTDLKDAIKADKGIHPHYSPRYLAIRLMDGDPEAEEVVLGSAVGEKIISLRDRKLRELERLHKDEEISELIAGEKYGFIAGALAETLTIPDTEKQNRTYVIDSIVTNRIFGFPFFIAVLFVIFWLTFWAGSYPQDWIQTGVDFLAGIVNLHMADGPLKDLIANGIIGGMGGVIVFLPNILILFFFLSFMEDTGYMARAAFIMDRLMHHIGLHGKSFIPLVMGFGCNVPAIIATRAIESRSSRLITILITPFMSCSARLPMYVLLIGTFFEPEAALVFLGMYVIGVMAAMFTARMLRKFFFRKDETPFVMELPPYRLPTLKTTLRHMWGKGKEYLNKMGGVILIASIIVWALNFFPLRGENPEDIQSLNIIESDEIDPSHDSYLEMMGKAVNPVLEPLGFSWRATVAALAGIPAKEIVVSTLGVLYTGSDEVSDATLSHRLTTPLHGASEPDFNLANALSFMIFILLYCPCTATVIAIVRETESWRYGAFAILYNTALAWVAAFAVYRFALLFM